jgi:hypothetical protein
MTISVKKRRLLILVIQLLKRCTHKQWLCYHTLSAHPLVSCIQIPTAGWRWVRFFTPPHPLFCPSFHFGLFIFVYSFVLFWVYHLDLCLANIPASSSLPSISAFIHGGIFPANVPGGLSIKHAAPGQQEVRSVRPLRYMPDPFFAPFRSRL